MTLRFDQVKVLTRIRLQQLNLLTSQVQTYSKLILMS